MSQPSCSPEPQRGRIAAVDYGSVRLGVAISDPDQRLVSPLENYTRRGTDADRRFFQQLVAEERIVRFVVGLPVHLDGRESQKSMESKAFGQWLSDCTGVPVVFFDERFTTFEADELMRQANLTSRQRKNRRDMLAAYQLLTAYLEAGAPNHSPDPQGLDG